MYDTIMNIFSSGKARRQESAHLASVSIWPLCQALKASLFQASDKLLE